MNEINHQITEKLDALRCTDVRVYDVRDKTPLAESFIVATSRSATQVGGASEAVSAVLKGAGVQIKHLEFKAKSLWCLIDCGDLVIHIFAPGERERMRFDELYDRCPCEVVSERVKGEDEIDASKVEIHELETWRRSDD